MNVNAELFLQLTGYAGLAALVGTRIYRVTLPVDPTLPAVTFQRIDTPREYSHDGDSHLPHPRFQISCWATTQSVAEAVADQVRGALRGWHLAYGEAAFVEDQADAYEPETGIYHIPLDATIWHHD